MLEGNYTREMLEEVQNDLEMKAFPKEKYGEWHLSIQPPDSMCIGLFPAGFPRMREITGDDDYRELLCTRIAACFNACKGIQTEQLKIANLARPRPLEEWHEDYGPVLWWAFPVVEPPYCGSPLYSDWPEYHTHWTTIPMPTQPIEGMER